MEIGNNLTYPSVIIDGDDNILLFARRTDHLIGKDPVAKLVFYKIDSNLNVSDEQTLIESRYHGYSDFSLSMDFDKTINRLHLIVNVHENSNDLEYGINQTIVYLYSDNFGLNWRSNHNSSDLSLPLDSLSFNPIFKGGHFFGNNISLGNVFVDQNSLVHFLFTVESFSVGYLYYAVLNQDDFSYKKLFHPSSYAKVKPILQISREILQIKSKFIFVNFPNN